MFNPECSGGNCAECGSSIQRECAAEKLAKKLAKSTIAKVSRERNSEDVKGHIRGIVHTLTRVNHV